MCVCVFVFVCVLVCVSVCVSVRACVYVYIERLADVLSTLHYSVRLKIKYKLQQEVFYEEKNLPR